MAIKPMVYVWGTKYSGAKKLMLLAIADACDDKGICFPGVDTLAEKCGVGTRAAQATITLLEQDGELTVFLGRGIKTPHGATNLYYMKKYRESASLQTPVAPSRILQMTPQGMNQSASLNDGMQKPASQGMNQSASQGMNQSASYPSGYPSEYPKEKESANLLHVDDMPIDSPIGDSLSEADPAIRGAALLENAFAVKADDSGSQPADSQSEEKTLLPVPAAQPLIVKSEPAPKKQRERIPMQEAVSYALNISPGSRAAKIGKFFAGTLPKSKDDKWSTHQPEAVKFLSDQLPQYILAFTLWYAHIDKYKATYEKQKSVPNTADILGERWIEFLERP